MPVRPGLISRQSLFCDIRYCSRSIGYSESFQPNKLQQQHRNCKSALFNPPDFGFGFGFISGSNIVLNQNARKSRNTRFVSSKCGSGSNEYSPKRLMMFGIAAFWLWGALPDGFGIKNVTFASIFLYYWYFKPEPAANPIPTPNRTRPWLLAPTRSRP